MRISVLLVALLIAPTLCFAQSTWYVPDDFTTIQGAVTGSSSGDSIIVRPGTYAENIDFLGKALSLASEQGAWVTVIDGGYSSNPDKQSVVTFRSGEGSDSILEGFTLTNGRGTKHQFSPGIDDICGAGIFCLNSSPTIMDVVFENDGDPQGVEYGGGMCTVNGSPSLEGCAFEENTSTTYGGGMYNNNASPSLLDCTFYYNDSDFGGGMYNRNNSSPSLTFCLFEGNLALSDYGGGMHNFDYSSPVLKYCSFINNEAPTGPGGGMYNGTGSSPTLSCCDFTENYAGNGAALYNFDGCSPVLNNCLLINNQSTGIGGAVFNGSSSPEFYNCTFTRNYSPTYGGAIHNHDNYSVPLLVNCILWGDMPDEISDINTQANITFSCIQGGYTGTGNINTDPLFIDGDGADNDLNTWEDNDHHILFTSPCRDNGDSLAVTELYDIEGDPRIANGTVDMGVDEFYPHMYIIGNKMPGGLINFKFTGVPGSSPVAYFIGTDTWDTPLNWWPYGLWYLKPPALGPYMLGSIPSPDGVITLSGNIPLSPPAPYTIYVHGLIGSTSTNLETLDVY